MDNENKILHASNLTYLHNTKITSSGIQREVEENEHTRNAKHPDWRCAALTEMLHVLLRYQEVYTNLRFVSICTISL